MQALLHFTLCSQLPWRVVGMGTLHMYTRKVGPGLGTWFSVTVLAAQV